MVEQTETQYEVERTQIGKIGIFDIGDSEPCVRASLPRLLDVFRATIQTCHVESHSLKEARKIADTTAEIQSGTQIQGGPYNGQEISEESQARFRQANSVRLIEDPGVHIGLV